MRRRVLAAVVVGGLLLTVLSLALGGPSAGSAQDDAAPTATRAAEEAEVADLRTRVAALSTEVARLGGTDEEVLAGRLGGSRSGFDEAYGRPVAFIGGDQVAYAVEDVGRLTVTFTDDRAVKIVVSPDRPADKPTSESDPADWSIDKARDVAAQFAPGDAEIPAPELDRRASDVTVSGTSTALATGAGTPTAAACSVAGGGGFDVVFTTPTRDTVSALTMTVTNDVNGPAPTPAPASDRTSAGGRTVATSSLPGTTTVNGVQVRGIQARFDGQDAGGAGRSVSVELAITNQTGGPLSLDAANFLLRDAAGRELAASCGGEAPEIAGHEIAAGESLDGWVTFRLPEDFKAERFVYLVNGSDGIQVAFLLR
jgi:hypothetical protein